MNISSLLLKHQSHIPFSFSKEIGNGFHGSVFELPDNPNKVIKFSKISSGMTGTYTLPQFYSKLIEVLAEQQSKCYPCLVSVFDFGLLSDSDYLLYYTVMEKLHPLTDDEKRVFKTICLKVDDFTKNDLLIITSLVKEQSKWLDFNSEKILSFIQSVADCPIEHRDFHRRNIMKDENNNFKLIDLDLSYLKLSK